LNLILKNFFKNKEKIYIQLEFFISIHKNINQLEKLNCEYAWKLKKRGNKKRQLHMFY